MRTGCFKFVDFVKNCEHRVLKDDDKSKRKGILLRYIHALTLFLENDMTSVELRDVYQLKSQPDAYAIIKHLVDKGYLTHYIEDAERGPRRVYTVSEKGESLSIFNYDYIIKMIQKLYEFEPKLTSRNAQALVLVHDAGKMSVQDAEHYYDTHGAASCNLKKLHKKGLLIRYFIGRKAWFELSDYGKELMKVVE